MQVVVAAWPDGSLSILTMPNEFTMSDLFWMLDDESDPLVAEFYLLKREDGIAHATFEFSHENIIERVGGKEPYIKLKPGAGMLGIHYGRLKKLKWPRGIIRQAFRSTFGNNPKSREVRVMSSEELSSFPAEPSGTFSVSEVRKMQPFCGVYFSYNKDGSCHYVGESKDVTSRVSSAREEIGDRRIGIIKCDPRDRKRIEAYFVAMLDPPGNAISTHRMKSEKARGEEAAS